MEGSVGCVINACETLVRGRILRVVEAVHLQRRLEALDIGLGLGDARLVNLVDDLGHDHRGQQADDDHDDHDLDEREASLAAPGVACGVSVNLVIVLE